MNTATEHWYNGITKCVIADCPLKSSTIHTVNGRFFGIRVPSSNNWICSECAHNKGLISREEYLSS